MLIEIAGKRYPLTHIEDLSLKHAMLLQRELAANPEISSLSTWGEIRWFWAEYMAMPKAERIVHPEALFLTALSVWASRVTAGEDLSLLDAVDFPAAQIRWIPEPSDRQAGEGPGKPKRPAESRGAGRPGKRK